MKKSLSVEGLDRTSFYTRSVKTSKIWGMKTLPCRTHKKTGLPCGNPVYASLYFPNRKELQTLLEVVLNTSGEPVVVVVLESGLFRKGLVISML